jgi:hypothetical protein
MAVEKGSNFVGRDVYIDYSFMKVMFRWDHIQERIYVRPYGRAELDDPVPHDNQIFNEATLYGSEISQEEYARGK